MSELNLAWYVAREAIMKFVSVTMVRIYITESSKLLNPILNYLVKTVKIRGVSVFRAIKGIGETGEHSSTLLDLSLDLPLTIEFFDEESKIETAIEYLSTIVKPEHIVCWEAQANDK
jgi:PII-like signaling protein